MSDDVASPDGSALSEGLGHSFNEALAVYAHDVWHHRNEDMRNSYVALMREVGKLVAAESERWQTLRDRIQADLERPEGRWGMHGRTAVDDDYFEALAWAVERMDEVLGPTRIRRQATARASEERVKPK